MSAGDMVHAEDGTAVSLRGLEAAGDALALIHELWHLKSCCARTAAVRLAPRLFRLLAESSFETEAQGEAVGVLAAELLGVCPKVVMEAVEFQERIINDEAERQELEAAMLLEHKADVR